MNPEYKYGNVPLVIKVAEELIIEYFLGKGNNSVSDIYDKVSSVHIERGGLPSMSPRLNTPVKNALNILKKKGQATSPLRGYWYIHKSSEKDIEEDIVKTIGEGEKSVYLYYYPRDRKKAKDDNTHNWQCKIGKADGDPYERMRNQIDKKTGHPESPKMGLIIKSDVNVSIERALDGILTAKGKKIKDAPGKEWYITSPSEVEDIYYKMLN